MGQQHLKLSFNKLAELLLDSGVFKYGCCCKDTSNVKTWKSHTHSHTQQQGQLSFFSSTKVFNIGLKSVFAKCYDVAVKLTSGTLNVIHSFLFFDKMFCGKNCSTCVHWWWMDKYTTDTMVTSMGMTWGCSYPDIWPSKSNQFIFE